MKLLLLIYYKITIYNKVLEYQYIVILRVERGGKRRLLYVLTIVIYIVVFIRLPGKAFKILP